MCFLLLKKSKFCQIRKLLDFEILSKNQKKFQVYLERTLREGRSVIGDQRTIRSDPLTLRQSSLLFACKRFLVLRMRHFFR